MNDTALASTVIARLRTKRLSLAVAESLTGGLLAAGIVAVPGASTVLRGGVLAYATDTKASVLGVDAAWLARYGPVDPRVALMMADGVRRLFETDIGLATTGVAGPGPDGDHPAGTAYVACTGTTGPDRIRSVYLAGDRRAIRNAVTHRALALLLP